MNIESCVRSLRRRVIQPSVSLLKVMLRSRRPSPHTAPAAGDVRPLIVMGNGPSLRSFIEFIGENPQLRAGCDLEAVNFAAITREFTALRPESYVLADPHFFNDGSPDEKVRNLWDSLSRCDWDMTLWLPLQFLDALRPLIARLPACVSVRYMNLTPVEGDGALADALIHGGWGMPRPRNVLIPAIMCGMRMGYDTIYIVGADHSWSRSLWVDADNRVVSIQPHFYQDDEKEKQRVHAEYAGYHLHDILNSLTVAFRSYFDIRRYADRHGYRIINATPESFIDAFPRCSYSHILPK